MIDFAFVAHGLTLSFAWFVVVNAAASALVVATARMWLRRTATGDVDLWLLLRLAPALGSVLFVGLLFIPSYWQYEPRDSVEGFDLTLTAAALAGVALLGASAVRGFAAWRSAARRVGLWVRQAHPVAASVSIPIFLVESERPMIALSGVWHYRLLITRGLLAALTPAELAAAIAHELGHRRALDNLKRLAMRAAPDLLRCTSVASELERRWASAAEHAADCVAVRSASARCALASALVKVARLTAANGGNSEGPSVQLAEPISTLIGGGEIASRVQRLLEDRDAAPRRSHIAALVVSCIACASIAAFGYTPLVQTVHEATEALIRILP